MSSPSFSNPLKSGSAVFLCAAAFALLTAAAVGVRAMLNASAVRPAHAQSEKERPRTASSLEAEVVTLTPHGFEPSEITRPSGPFVLTLDNRSGLESFTFRLETDGGARLKEVRVAREDLDWNGVLDPPQGSYTVTEADHPDWVCRVNIR